MGEEVVIEPQDELKEVLEEGGQPETEVETEEVETKEKEAGEKEVSEDDKPKKKTQEERQAEMNKATWKMRDAERKAGIAEKRANEALKKLDEREASINEKLLNRENYDSDEEFEAVKKTLKPQNNNKTESDEEVYDRLDRQKRDEKIQTDYVVKRGEAIKADKSFEANEEQIINTINYYGARHLQESILGSEKSIELVNYLASKPDEADKIAQLSPLGAARELGKIEAQLESKPAKPRISKAPAPISGVKGGTAPKGHSGQTQAEFDAERNKKQFGY